MSDYTTLQADLLSWSVRDDLSTQAPSFIRVAEAEIGRVVRVLEMETDGTLSAPSPTFEVALPANFLGFKHVYVTGSSSPRAAYLPPDLFHELKNTPDSSFAHGQETQYTIESAKLKVLAPSGSPAPIVFNVTYFKRFDPLATTPSNQLLTDHYDVYLYASLAALWSFVGSLPDEVKYQTKFDRAVAQLDTSEGRRRRGSGPNQVRTPIQVTT